MHNIFETLNNPSMLHAALVHFPVVLATLGLLTLALLTYFNDKMNLRWLSIAIYGMCVVSGWLAEETGEGAMGMVSNRLNEDIWALINEHQAMGERVFIMAGITLFFLLISLIEHDSVRKIMTLFSLVGGLATFSLVSFTAHYGGVLVYQHGVGTPMSHVGYEGMATALGTPQGDIAIHAIDMEEAKKVSFRRDVWPIIDEHCIACHETPEPDGGYAMDTFELMMQAGPKGGASIVPGKADESSIVLYIRGIMKPRMPQKKDPLSEEKLHTIRMWIAAGAVDDSASATAEESAPTTDTAPTPVDSDGSDPVTPFDPFAGEEVQAPEAPATEADTFYPFGGSAVEEQPESGGAEEAPESFDPFAVEESEELEESPDTELIIEENSEALEPQPDAVQDNVQIEAEGEGEELQTPTPAPPAPVFPRRNPLFDPFAA